MEQKKRLFFCHLLFDRTKDCRPDGKNTNFVYIYMPEKKVSIGKMGSSFYDENLLRNNIFLPCFPIPETAGQISLSLSSQKGNVYLLKGKKKLRVSKL